MSIINFYIFDRGNRNVFMLTKLPDDGTGAAQNPKILSGLVQCLRSFTARLAPFLQNESNDFIAFSNNVYRLYIYESPSGIKLVLVLSPRRKTVDVVAAVTAAATRSCTGGGTDNVHMSDNGLDSTYYRHLLFQIHSTLYFGAFVIPSQILTEEEKMKMFRADLLNFFQRNALIFK